MPERDSLGSRPRRTGGVLRGRSGSYVCHTDVAEVSVPATLQAAIAARIDRLGGKAKRALSAAAVIGLRFDTELLASFGVEPESLTN